MADRVVHVYGVVRSGVDVPLPCAGIGGAAVELQAEGAVSAVLSDLTAECYGPKAWEAHREDASWLGEVAAAHDDVLRAIVEHVDVLPLRLPALHHDRDEVARALHEDRQRFLSALSEIEGHVEWGAKVYLVDDDAAESGVRPQPSSGRDYLMRKAAEAGRKEEQARARQNLVLDAHEALALGSTHAVVNQPQDRALSGRAEPMLLNAAYLVPREAREGFLALADQVADRLFAGGLVLEVNGPWPAYNFTGRAGQSASGRTP
jgi:hypothetical protein